jgi:hypothetical protein
VRKTQLLKFSFLSCMLFLSASRSFGGVLLEPYAGYVFGSGSSGALGTDIDESYTTPILGGRVGGIFRGLMFGLDYSYETFTMKSTVANSADNDKVEKTQPGLFVGIKFPVILRLWGTYFLKGEMKGKDSPVTGGSQYITSDLKFKDGSGFGAGAGFNFLPFIGLNLEYRNITYSKQLDQGVEQNGTVYTKKMNLTEFLVSLSLPLDL